ncbi:hypothetical protein LT335_00196 [Spiroplasma sp. JKS002669]|uniref:hypothetical protein n=1 Tax=Spiroplasma attinicola TaxID=2904537 RepID=UPI0020BDD766|nr:hypothetical protein [Spiroplasma sp. JKS002669]MCL6428657.1 hypothetical protein [Spiroplasma sp. JKS002669]
MTKKIIKLSLLKEDNNFIIEIFCDNISKLKVPKNNIINAKDIYESLEYNTESTYKLEEDYSTDDIKNFPDKVLKPFNELKDLYTEIINEINNINKIKKG